MLSMSFHFLARREEDTPILRQRLLLAAVQLVAAPVTIVVLGVSVVPTDPPDGITPRNWSALRMYSGTSTGLSEEVSSRSASSCAKLPLPRHAGMFERKIEDVGLRLDLLCLLPPVQRRRGFMPQFSIGVCVSRASAKNLCWIANFVSHNSFLPTARCCIHRHVFIASKKL